MSTSQSTIDFILDQISAAGSVSARKMFGEYAIYCDEKVVALVCDEQLFIKPTNAGKACLTEIIEGFPYPGAKPYLLISEELWDEAEWLSSMIRATADELPIPKKKVKKK